MDQTDECPDPGDLTIGNPKAEDVPEPVYPWVLVAQNSRVLKGWRRICEQMFENAVRCYSALRRDPRLRVTGRRYELKHKNYAGVWAYEIGSGHRLYYRIDDGKREVLIYYAGPHPSKVPYPPK